MLLMKQIYMTNNNLFNKNANYFQTHFIKWEEKRNNNNKIYLYVYILNLTYIQMKLMSYY